MNPPYGCVERLGDDLESRRGIKRESRSSGSAGTGAGKEPGDGNREGEEQGGEVAGVAGCCASGSSHDRLPRESSTAQSDQACQGGEREQPGTLAGAVAHNAAAAAAGIVAVRVSGAVCAGVGARFGIVGACGIGERVCGSVRARAAVVAGIKGRSGIGTRVGAGSRVGAGVGTVGAACRTSSRPAS
jgi:hypothetical protein